jgi:hypothetical protein
MSFFVSASIQKAPKKKVNEMMRAFRLGMLRKIMIKFLDIEDLKFIRKDTVRR